MTRLFALRSVAAVAVLALLAGPASAGNLINFDPDGAAGPSGTLSVKSFDFLPANALSSDVQPIAQDTVAYTQYAHARLGSLVGANDLPLNVPGLASGDYEITIMAEYRGQTQNPFPDVFLLGADTTQPSSVKLFFDDTPDSDMLAGTGFGDGQLIFEGSVTDVSGIFQVTDTNKLFDKSNGDNYGGQLSDKGNGSVDVTIAPSALDGDFFKSTLLETVFSTNSKVPFEDVNPSGRFNSTPANPAGVTPNLGSVNSPNTLDDFQFQTDGAATFLVPEPSTLALVALGGIALLRRRKA